MADSLIKERRRQVFRKGTDDFVITGEKVSAAGSVSQRACVFCGSRVVLYPIADALHLVHGPIGCAAYTWDIRGALSSGPELHRKSFSTDLREDDVIFGGEKKLSAAMDSLIPEYKPSAVFVYSTCIVGIIGDDVEAVCRKTSAKFNIPVIPVHSEGFKGTKKDGYKAACTALSRLIHLKSDADKVPVKREPVINILGEFNLAGEAWMIQSYYDAIGVKVGAILTGDGRVERIQNSYKSALNVVQCSGSLKFLAKDMENDFGIPFKQVSYFGIEDTAEALYTVAEFFSEVPGILEKTRDFVHGQLKETYPKLMKYKSGLAGKKAAVYVGGAFKAISLLKSLKYLGVKVVLMGSQTGTTEDYEEMKDLADPGTIIVDDSNPSELAQFIEELDVDLFIGGVKERPMAFKLGVGFCDHNHERKIALTGFEGMLNFAEEVYSTLNTPVWGVMKEARRNNPWTTQ